MNYETILHKRYVLGIFHSKKQMSECILRLKRAHYVASNISILVPNAEQCIENNFLQLDKQTKNPESALTGAGLGVVIGGAIGISLGVGYIPIVELSMTGGTLLTTLAGILFGGTLGGIGGGLIGREVPEDDAKDYEKKLHKNEMMVSVHVDDELEADQTMQLFHEVGASKVLLNEENAKFSESVPNKRLSRNRN